MSALYHVGNVDSVSRKIILSKGYKITFFDEPQVYVAENGTWKFRAETETALLGLIHLIESKPERNYEDWLCDETSFQDIKGVIQQRPKPYTRIYYDKFN